MWFDVSLEQDHLKADLFGRETAEQTREFLQALTAESLKLGCARILISVHASRPIFKVEQYHFSAYIKELSARSSYKIALLGDTDEMRASHEYIETLARQHGVNIRCLPDELAAVHWLRSIP